jgi:putative urate catabolism protein
VQAIHRDLVGYGSQPPDPKWPGGAQVALNFVVNYEEGAEYSIPEGDAHSETILSEQHGGAPTPGVRSRNMESLYEFGSRVGIWRTLEVFRDREISPTIYIVGRALELNPAVGEAIGRAGYDIVGHGWRWIDYQDIGLDEEREHIHQSVNAIEKLTGRRPLGWYTGRPSGHTRWLVVEEGGFLFDSDDYNDELPYWVEVAGKQHLVIPHSFDTNDSRFARGSGLETGEQFFTYLRDSFDWLHAEGARAPKMMTVSLHCRLIGRPGRIGGLAQFLDYVLRKDKVWICGRTDIAKHWHARRTGAPHG